jgi:signal peptidase I
VAWGGLLSALIPGLGQIYARAWRLGISFIAIQIGVLAACRLATHVIAATPTTVGLVLFCLACLMLFHIGAGIEAACRIRLRPTRTRLVWYRSTWFTAIVASLVTIIVARGIPTAWPAFSISQNGNLPTLPAGALVVFDSTGFPKLPYRGDTVVFKLPRDPKVIYVKRVVGLPDDVIQYREGRLFLNQDLVPRQRVGELVVVEGKRGKSVGNPSFFPCADSVRPTLCIMCRRPPPFPR